MPARRQINFITQYFKEIKMKKIILFTLSALLLVMLFTGCSKKKETIVVGSKDFTEQDILGYIQWILINEHTDLNTSLVNNLNSSVIYEAIKSGDVNVYMDYTGTIYGNYFGHTEKRTPDEVFEIARAGMKDKFNILVLDRIGFNNTYTLSVRPNTAQMYNLKTLSDLAKVSQQFILGASMEFLNREDGLLGVKKVYGMEFKSEKAVDGALRYISMENDEIQVTDAFSTDGMLLKYDLVVLEDNMEFFPPYHAAVLIRQDTAEKYPQLVKVLNMLIGKLNDDSMRDLNYRVDVLQESPETVARNFLKEAGLIKK